MRRSKIGRKTGPRKGWIYKKNEKQKRGSIEAIKKQMKSKIDKERVIEIYDKRSLQLISTCLFSTQAQTITGVNSKNIQQNLRGVNKTAGDFIFKYKILN